MKILIINNHSYMLYRFRKELIFALSRENEVVISTPFVGHEQDFEAGGVRCIETDVDRRGINPKTDLKLIKIYKKLFKIEKPDLVITYSIKPNIYAGYLCGKMKIPFYANVQGLGTAFQKKLLGKMVTWMYRFAFRKVSGVFFENECNAAEFRERKILKAEKQILLKGAGINLEEFPACEYPHEEPFRFLYLGRIMKEKGMDELFAAVRRLKEDGEAFVLDLVGFFEDSYKEQVEELQSEKIAVFHGFQADPRPFYEKANCVVLPSYHEGMSNVLLEAAATSRPLITSDIPGCREAVTAESGLLCAAGDAEGLYRAMKGMLSLSADERAAMGRAGRSLMEATFDKKSVVAQTLSALHVGKER